MCPLLAEMTDFPNAVFYLVRHPQSQSNAEKRFAGGGMDTPLSEQGAGWQMKELLETVAALEDKPTAVFHTGLTRTREPAGRIASLLKLPAPQEVPELKERIWGSLAGQPKSPSPLPDGDTLPPDVERREDFFARSNAALAALLREQAGRLPLVMGHRGNTEALCDAFGLRTAMKPANAAVYQFSIRRNPAKPQEQLLTATEFYLDSRGNLAQRTLPLVAKHAAMEIRK
jgi:broad specificity phosphatase PhoE